MLAAMKRSLEDGPKSEEDQEQIIRQKYRSLHGGPGGRKFDNHFRNWNDVITQSRLQIKDKGLCMVLDTGDESGSDTIESQLERARRSRASRSSSPDNISVSKRLKCDSDDDVMTREIVCV